MKPTAIPFIPLPPPPYTAAPKPQKPRFSLPPPLPPPPTTEEVIDINSYIFLIIAVFLFSPFILFFYCDSILTTPPEISINSVSLSNHTAINGRINAATIDASFFIHIRHKNWKIPLTNFNDVVSTVFYKKRYLAATAIAPFSMEKDNDTTVEVRLRAVDGIFEEELVNGTVMFDFQVETTWGRDGREEVMKVWCDGVIVSGATGKMVSQPMLCKLVFSCDTVRHERRCHYG